MRSARAHVVGVLIAGVVIGGLLGLAGAAAKSSSGRVVHACVAGAGGAVRFVGLGKACLKGESGLLLDQVGPAGKAGKAGKTGKTGAVGVPGGVGAVGPTGPAGPAGSELVQGPVETLLGSDLAGNSTGEVAVSTASCGSAVNPANVEAYGGGVNIVTSPQTQARDIVELQSSYPVEATGPTGATGATGVTGPLGAAVGQGQSADAWSGEAVVSLLRNASPPDSASVQTYVICGP